MDYRGLRRLLVIHGFITLSAAVVLTIAPDLIPSAVGIRLDPSTDLLAYLLAGAEVGFAVLSFGGSRIADPRALRLIVWSCVAFHCASGGLEIYAYVEGVGVAILGNVIARAVIIALFVYLSKDRAGPAKQGLASA